MVVAGGFEVVGMLLEIRIFLNKKGIHPVIDNFRWQRFF
jgi:hypothetical protein